MIPATDRRRRNSIFTAALAAALLLWLCPYLLPTLAGKEFLLPGAGRLLLYPRPGTTILWAAACLVLPAAAALYARRLRQAPLAAIPGQGPGSLRFRVLLLLPLAAFIMALRPLLDQPLVAGVAFYLPVLVFALLLRRGWQSPEKAGATISTRLITGVGIAFLLFYWLTGWYFTLAAGEHAGDEGHYIIQAKSLHADRDLDLYNNFDPHERKLLEAGGEVDLHISPTSREGKYYSWHPFGLPLYLSLLPPDRLVLRHLLLGLLSGLGSAGLLLLCRQLSVGRGWGLLSVGLFSLSAVWGIYSSRVLPEMPGAVAAIWTGVALLAAPRRPWWAALLVIICCGFLPFLHQRFTPISLFGYLFLMYQYLRRPAGPRWSLIAFTSAGLVLLAAVYLGVNASMFSTGVGYAAHQFIFYPAGVWEVMTSDQSITAILPSFACIFTAAVLFPFRSRTFRSYGIFALLSFSAVMILSCTNSGWSGGASTIGRYLLAVTPLLLPPAASVLERSNRTARWWFVFLSLVSLCYLLLILFRLPEFFGNFGDPRHYIGVVYGPLRDLLNPFPPAATPISDFTLSGSLFPVLFFLFSLALILHRRNSRLLLIYPLLAGAAAIAAHHPDSRATMAELPPHKGELVRKHNALDWTGYRLAAAVPFVEEPAPPHPLFAAADLFALYRRQTLPAVTTVLEPAALDQPLVRQADMPPNDWQGRPLFWTTLGFRFASEANDSAFLFEAELEGEAEAELVVVELGGSAPHVLLARSLGGGGGTVKIEERHVLRPTGDGSVHILVRIVSGAGTLRPVRLGWSPFSERLLKATRAFVPAEFEQPAGGEKSR